MDGLEVFLQMETVAAITYLKVILTVTSAKEREQCFFPKQIISGCVIACLRYIKKSNRRCFCNLFQTIYKPKLKRKKKLLYTYKSLYHYIFYNESII